MSFSSFLSSDRKLPATLTLAFLPWTAVVLYTGGSWAVVNFIAYAILVLAAGYALVALTLPAAARLKIISLAPATGTLAFSALTAFWVRLGFPLIWVPVLWLGLAAAGGLALWRDRASWAKSIVAYGLTLALLSVLVCAVFFLPTASNDMVQRRDGSFNWRFVDTQHFHSVAASVKYSEGRPTTPGTFTSELFYHFGPYAPAAVISKLDGLDLGDAVARVTRGASLWALVLSCFGLGTLLSLKANGKSFGGIISVAGLFFYGALLALFTDGWTGSGHTFGAILITIPGIRVIGDGGPFDHLLVGHSLLHCLGAITAILGLCLAGSEHESAPTWREGVLLALPALAVPVNLLAALYSLGAAGILLFWGRLRAARSWLSISLMVGLFLAAWHIIGYGHAPDVAHVTIKDDVASQWWTLAVWLIIGLGFRITAFRWISRPLKDPLSLLVLTSVLGWLAYGLPFNLVHSNERYGIYFLQALLSIFAFSRVTSGCWRGVERSAMIAEWLRLATKCMVFVCVGGVLIAGVAVATHHHTGIAHFGPKLLVSCLLLALLAAISSLIQRSRRFLTVSSAVIMGVLLTGFLAWMPEYIRYGIGEVKSGITSPPGEVLGLRRLGELAAPHDRFATNKHALDPESLAPPNELSYGYSALSERPVLLEGYLSRGENLLPWFGTLLHDNDLLFSATDPETLRSIARTYRVRWLVARPGTDISLPRPLPAWLAEQKDCGTLKVYRID
jgi:hypothetical protein